MEMKSQGDIVVTICLYCTKGIISTLCFYVSTVVTQLSMQTPSLWVSSRLLTHFSQETAFHSKTDEALKLGRPALVTFLFPLQPRTESQSTNPGTLPTSRGPRQVKSKSTGEDIYFQDLSVTELLGEEQKEASAAWSNCCWSRRSFQAAWQPIGPAVWDYNAVRTRMIRGDKG